MTKKEPKTVTRRERVVYITNKIQKIKASIHSFIQKVRFKVTGRGGVAETEILRITTGLSIYIN